MVLVQDVLDWFVMAFVKSECRNNCVLVECQAFMLRVSVTFKCQTAIELLSGGVGAFVRLHAVAVSMRLRVRLRVVCIRRRPTVLVTSACAGWPAST